jgi:cell wall-associated NlpC family hydrolase
MASHSPRSHRRPTAARLTARASARTAVTLALASAASVTLFGETGNAQPGAATPGEVKAEVDALYQQAEAATESYNGAKEQADTARHAVDDLQDELARKTARFNETRDTIGSLAAAQYRTGGIDPTVQLVLSSSPDAYLERAGLLDKLGSRQTAALARLAAERQDVTRTHDAADAKLTALRSAQERLAARKRVVQTKLAQAQALLDRLSAPERAAVDASDGSSAPTTRAATRSPLSPAPGLPGAAAPSPRAAQAVAFAYRALGLPYVWGATGPNAYDCSGLTQAAWKSAGVSLPRTTYTQINAGTRVAESALQPGDLVFFYSGISHVGIYIGNGQMIHAPHPGAPVRIAPISEMPFAGATRPS